LKKISSHRGWLKPRAALLNSPQRYKDDAGDVDQLEHLRLAAKRLSDLAAAVGPHLANSDWHRRRDMIRTLVQRIEIGLEVIKIVFRLMRDARNPGPVHCCHVVAGVKE
jgi:hypothetical protein